MCWTKCSREQNDFWSKVFISQFQIESLFVIANYLEEVSLCSRNLRMRSLLACLGMWRAWYSDLPNKHICMLILFWTVFLSVLCAYYALNPNWHDRGHFFHLVLFSLDFVSWILGETFQTFWRQACCPWGCRGCHGPFNFGRSVNPISTKGGKFCPPNNTGTPGFHVINKNPSNVSFFNIL